MKTKLVILILFLFTTANSQNYLNKPESVAFDSLNNRFLVSNAGDGKIVAIDYRGNQSIPFSIPTAAVGNHIYGNVLYVSSGVTPRIYGFDLDSDQLLRSYPVIDALSIDGLTADTSGHLCLTPV